VIYLEDAPYFVIVENCEIGDVLSGGVSILENHFVSVLILDGLFYHCSAGAELPLVTTFPQQSDRLLLSNPFLEKKLCVAMRV
jgi:hypothetical protein